MKKNNICQICNLNEHCLLMGDDKSECKFCVDWLDKKASYNIIGWLRENLNEANKVGNPKTLIEIFELKKEVDELYIKLNRAINDIEVKNTIIDELKWKLDFTQKMVDKLIESKK